MVEAGIAAKPIGRVKINNDQVHRPIGLRLQDEAALELQRRADQRRQHNGFAEEACHRLRIIVAGEDLVERIRQANDAAAAVELLEGEGDNHVVAGFGAVNVVEPLTELVRLGLINGGYR